MIALRIGNNYKVIHPESEVMQKYANVIVADFTFMCNVIVFDKTECH